MPASVTFTCDRDGTVGTSDTQRPPQDWTMLTCSVSNDTGGVGSARLVFCPTCTVALEAFVGSPLVPAPPPLVR